jgi:hypothetical protein
MRVDGRLRVFEVFGQFGNAGAVEFLHSPEQNPWVRLY